MSSLVASVVTSSPFIGRAAARLLSSGAVGFIGEHAVFSTSTTTPFLAANLFYPSAFDSHESALLRLNFIQEQAASEEAVKTLLPSGLTLYL